MKRPQPLQEKREPAAQIGAREAWQRVAQRKILGGKKGGAEVVIPDAPLFAMDMCVSRLGPTTTDEDLKEYFSKFGKLVRAHVLKDKITGVSKRLGWILYETVAEEDLCRSPRLRGSRRAQSSRCWGVSERIARSGAASL